MRSASRRLVHLLALVAALFSVRVALACIWDNDTLKAESSGRPGVLQVLAGRFDMLPAEYYEARLRHSESLIAADPLRLEEYDNAGAACDRLHRADEAVAWMRRKLAILEEVEAAGTIDKQRLAEHRYRYLANIGTFLAHRWLDSGADRDRLEDLTSGASYIEQAIAIKPNAHFGRERYQLLAMKWLILNPSPDREPSTLFDADPAIRADRLGALPDRVLTNAGYTDAVEGLSGLIRLGAAWQSVDISLALAIALADSGDSAIAKVAMRRVEELIRTGKHSLNKGNTDELVMSARPGQISRSDVDDWFAAARAEAESWRVARNAYVLKRLSEGQHPDWSDAFWSQWAEPGAPPELPVESQPPTIPFRETSPPAPPGTTLAAIWHANPGYLVAGVAVGTALLIVVVRELARRRKRTHPPREA